MTSREPSATPGALSPGVLGAARAQILGWSAFALVAAVEVLLTVRSSRADAAMRAAHVFFVAGQAVAIGLLSALAVSIWRWIRPRLPLIGRRARPFVLDSIALTIAAIALGFLFLPADLAGFAGRLASSRAALEKPILVLAVITVSLGITAAALLGRALDRPILRWLGVLGLLGAAIATHHVLVADYPGAHVFLAWAGVALGGAAIAGLRSPSLSASRARVARIASIALLLPLAAAAAAAVLIKPDRATNTQLYRTGGSILVPFLASLRSDDDGASRAVIPRDQVAWFIDRSRVAPVPPTPRAAAVKDPVVILITLDSFRADVLTKPENLARMPTLAAWKRESVEFQRARAPGSGTVHTLTSLFSGRYFSQLFWSQKPPDGYWAHRDRSVRFPEILSRAGIPTVNYGSTRWLINEYGVVRGFTEDEVIDIDQIRKRTPKADRMVSRIIERLKEQGEGPLFLYTHFMDSHHPFYAGSKSLPEPERYLAAIAWLDGELGRLRKALTDLDLDRRTMLIVSADHGEAFGEHGMTFHGLSLYEEVIRVPLLVKAPGAVARAIDQPVSVIDVGPTVLDWMGLDTPGTYMGQSLVPFLIGRDPELTRPIVTEQRLKKAMILPDGFKVILDSPRGTLEVYDLSRDPGELSNLYRDGRSDPRVSLLSAFFHGQALQRRGYKPPSRP